MGLDAVDPVETAGTYAAEASFQRLPGLSNPKGVSRRSAAPPGSYVRHDKGRLVVGHASGSKSTFFLG
ncbi:AbfB domain-containing protein [Terrabacter ginsenosidimutans]|uniref:AbfB domain-containing protein n=1 Tax=Terrabacter ginsenosidimutans TaxID=490575 RepID=UPI003CD08E5B